MTKNKLKEIVKLVQQDPEFIKAVLGHSKHPSHSKPAKHAKSKEHKND